VAREIVTLHGGLLTVEARAGGGATFVLVLPKVAA
jgi:signal transduction histidine kinase